MEQENEMPSAPQRKRFGLKKSDRLRRSSDFQLVYEQGREYANSLMALKVRVSEGQGLRAGFAAGKRLGSAVKRNYVKRVLREAYRVQKQNLRRGLDLIWVGRKGIINAEAWEVRQAMADLCRRAKILANETPNTMPDKENKDNNEQRGDMAT